MTDTVLPSPQGTPRERMLAACKDVSAHFQERGDVCQLLLVGMLTKRNVLLLGPPGTAKSDVIRCMTAHCSDARYGQYLMAPETSKDELVGPLKISALRDRDAYERNHTGTAAGVEVFFADETFRGNSGARNALLELMNERTYNGVPVPLRIMVGATNIEDTSVNAEAFNDRFLLRMFVDRIQDPLNFAAYLGAMANRVEYKPNPAHTFTLTEWSQASGDIKSVVIPPGVTAELIKLRDKCHTGKIYVSDRRWGQLLLVLQAKAWLEGLASVEVDHLEILRYGLWLKLSDRVAVDAMISTLDSGDITWISEQADEVLRAVRTWQAKGPQERADTASKIAQTKATAMDAITGKMAGLGPRAKAKAVEKIAEIDATYAPVKKELNRLIAGL